MTLRYAMRQDGSQFAPNGRPVGNARESVAGKGSHNRELVLPKTGIQESEKYAASRIEKAFPKEWRG